MRPKRLDQYHIDNRETNDKRNPLYTLTTINSIFPDIFTFPRHCSFSCHYLSGQSFLKLFVCHVIRRFWFVTVERRRIAA